MKSKDEAGYRESKDEARECGNCSMFLPAVEKCTLVKGLIRAEDVCNYWEAKRVKK